MKILILDENNKQKEIDAGNIEANGKTLANYIKETDRFKAEVKVFMSKFNTREENLHEMWNKLR